MKKKLFSIIYSVIANKSENNNKWIYLINVNDLTSKFTTVYGFVFFYRLLTNFFLFLTNLLK